MSRITDVAVSANSDEAAAVPRNTVVMYIIVYSMYSGCVPKEVCHM